jgi:hypothetical protein
MVDQQRLKLIGFLTVMIVGSIAVVVHIHLHDMPMPCTYPGDPNSALLNQPPQAIDLAVCTAVSRFQNAIAYYLGRPTVIACFPLFITTHMIVTLEVLAHLKPVQVSSNDFLNMLFKFVFLGGFCAIAMVIGQLYGIFVTFPLFWFPVYMLCWKIPSQRQNRTFSDFQVGFVSVILLISQLAQYGAYSPQVQGTSLQQKALVYYIFAPAIPCFVGALQELFAFALKRPTKLEMDEEAKRLQIETLLVFFAPFFIIGFVTHWIAMIWVSTIPNGYSQLLNVFIAFPDFPMVWAHLYLVNYLVLMGAWMIWGVWEIGIKQTLYLIFAGVLFSPTALVVGFYILRQLSFHRRQDSMNIPSICKELIIVVRESFQNRAQVNQAKQIDRSSARL